MMPQMHAFAARAGRSVGQPQGTRPSDRSGGRSVGFTGYDRAPPSAGRTTLRYIIRQKAAMPDELKDSQLSLRLPNDLKDKMEAYAQLTGRTKSYVAMEALGSYLEWRIPQIKDLKAAVRAADEGDFASDAEVAAVLARPALRGKRVAVKPVVKRGAA